MNFWPIVMMCLHASEPCAWMHVVAGPNAGPHSTLEACLKAGHAQATKWNRAASHREPRLMAVGFICDDRPPPREAPSAPATPSEPAKPELHT